MTDSQIELLAAAVLDVLGRGGDYTGRFQRIYEAVKSSWKGDFEEEHVRLALNTLAAVRGYVRSNAAENSDYIRVNAGLALTSLESGVSVNGILPQRDLPLLYEYSQFGHDWLIDVWTRYYPSSVKTSDMAGIPNRNQIAIPASDRVVHFNHNEVGEAVRASDELIIALEQDNGNPNEPGLRERILGQLKAGRELLISGVYRAYLLYESTVSALFDLVERYGAVTLVALANALLGAIVGKLI